jgi:predicted secreted hydrolase
MKQRPIKLPDDMRPHDTIIEWWYFNGALTDAKGNKYSFMDCLFRADANKVKIPYLKNLFGRSVSGKYVLFAHSMLADIATQKIRKDVQNISFASGDSFSRPLFYVNYIDPVTAAGGFVVHEMAEIVPSKFHIKTETLDLVMESKKKPMLEGEKGFITVRGRDSFYYSLTDLATSGAVRVGDDWVPVKGRSWMDHQWADVAYAKDRWTWFSIRLDDGTDIMCVEYSDGKGKDCVVDILDVRGNTAHSTSVTFTPGKKAWKSKTTKAEYPLSWMIEIPEKDIVLGATAAISDGEMIFGAINYWEGPVVITGAVGGKKVKGVGFMELAGYPSDYNYLLLTGKKVNARLQQELSTRIKSFWR